MVSGPLNGGKGFARNRGGGTRVAREGSRGVVCVEGKWKSPFHRDAFPDLTTVFLGLHDQRNLARSELVIGIDCLVCPDAI
jgi:hypothetical protein